ncbi:MAG: hypothetical protein KKF52_04580 [Nanoarchaeota archaeon]|nr:hypothetical protein [Nanoarchaeota archaeon]MBU4242479.1 hypothetical protein [Nanoarchaeota archaeon]MBU4351987.1 hypothetical protein [Nanoarchaeota archaeon]
MNKKELSDVVIECIKGAKGIVSKKYDFLNINPEKSLKFLGSFETYFNNIEKRKSLKNIKKYMVNSNDYSILALNPELNILRAGIYIGAGLAVLGGGASTLFISPWVGLVVSLGSAGYTCSATKNYLKLKKVNLDELDSVLQENEVKIKGYLYPRKNE